MGFGTLIDAVGIIAGGLIGMLIGHKISTTIQDAILKVAAVSVIFLGTIGACEQALVLAGNKIVSHGALMLVVSMTLGTLIGELIDIEGMLESLGTKLEKVMGGSGDNSFVTSFIVASITTCVGAMSIIGAIQEALFNDCSVLMAKAVLDFITVLIFTATTGRGAIFSVVPLVIFQGGLTFLAKYLEPIMTDAALSNLSLVGSIMIFCIGTNLFFNMKLRVANMIPAIFIAVIFAFLPL